MCWLSDQPWILDLVADVSRARQGFLLEAGGVGDQDARFVEGWQVLEQAHAICQAREAKSEREAHERRLKEIERKTRGKGR